MLLASGLAAVFLVLLGATAWVAVTQPLLTTPALDRGEGRADPQRLEAHVRALCACSPRDVASVANLDRAAAYIRGELERSGAPVTEQPFQVDGRVYRNVTARYGPEQGALVVLGAHYDTCGRQPGADDNASGVAGLLEAARLLAACPPSGPVELVAYTLEEPPIFRSLQMGSAVHAASLKSSGAKVRSVIVLEMIGCFEQGAVSQSYPLPLLSLFYPNRGNFIAVVGSLGQPRLVRRIKASMRAASPLPVRSINAPAAVPGVDFSDHLSYWREGYPAVMITDTAFYRNPRYHSEEDTPETLDYIRMAQAVDGVRAAVLREAGR